VGSLARRTLSAVHLPAALCSSGITPILRSYGGSASPSLLAPQRGLPASRTRPSLPFRHQTPWAPCCRFRTLPLSATGFPPFREVWVSSFLRRLTAFQAESCSLSCGPGARLPMLPTPPCGEAVSVNYRPESACLKGTCTPRNVCAHRRT
jgi:hypothetical protein